MGTTLIYDLNNLMMRNLFSPEIGIESESPNFDLWRFQVFDQIYHSIVKFRPVTEVVLAVDDRMSWRRVYFPRYKESRSKKRKEEVDWEQVYFQMDKLKEDLKNNIPFKVIHQTKTEADDIIGVLSLNQVNDSIIVVSNDEDFKQLQTDSVKIYNPNKKEFFKLQESKQKFLDRLCLKGQAKDDIFNAKTPSDYPSELRKPGMGDKTVDKTFESGLQSFLDSEVKIDKTYKTEDGEEGEYVKRFLPRDLYERNRVLIDFTKIPNIISEGAMKKYKEYELPSPEKIYPFFKTNGWNHYLDNYEITEKTLLKLY